ncbi:DUF4862 family protein [Paenarthrobacter aromaticivorans]|uniref:DUF4862 family protein n=1 Tax=Paenarthrobacter aromaticivorans TaxID=2849150 RepID=UPI003A7F88DE
MPQHYEQNAFFVGAYAAAPSLIQWDPVAEGTFLKSVLALQGVAGLEVPFTGALHKDDEAWFLQQLPEHADYVVTTIPGTMARLGADPAFGLASTSATGRRAAIGFVHEALQAVTRLNSRVGRPAVTAVEIHSAPVASNGQAAGSALSESLAEICSWDWQGARVVLEHCDAYIAGQTPSKGFLTLEAEAEAVHRANSSGGTVGMSINWGRSVIEQRRPEAALEHISYVRNAGLLAGLVLSGCTDQDSRFGPAWADVHVPPAPATSGTGQETAAAGRFDRTLEPASLMTAARIQECLLAAGPRDTAGFRGIKVAAAPNASVEERISTIAGSVELSRRMVP